METPPLFKPRSYSSHSPFCSMFRPNHASGNALAGRVGWARRPVLCAPQGVFRGGLLGGVAQAEEGPAYLGTWLQHLRTEDAFGSSYAAVKMPKADSTDSVGWEREKWLTKKRKVPNGTISVGTIKMCTCWKQAERMYLKTLTLDGRIHAGFPSLAFSL